jgi:hypothetical protein
VRLPRIHGPCTPTGTGLKATRWAISSPRLPQRLNGPPLAVRGEHMAPDSRTPLRLLSDQRSPAAPDLPRTGRERLRELGRIR